MKKIFVSILVIVVFCTFLCSCGHSLVDKPRSDVSTWGATESQAAFYLLIKDNPIDMAYQSDSCGETLSEMVAFQQKYAVIWQEELEFSCRTFKAFLNEEHQSRFEILQENWESGLLENRQFVQDVFGSEDYDIYMGKIFTLEQASQYCKAIRERVLLIKYWQYCMEENTANTSHSAVFFQYGHNAVDGYIDTGDGSVC